MTIFNAASLLGAASSAAKMLGKNGGSDGLQQYAPYANIAATALGKLAEKLPELAEKFKSEYHNAEKKLDGLSGAELALYPRSDKQPVSVHAAIRLMNQWDTDKNGVLSKNELQQGLSQTQGKIDQQKAEVAQTGDPIDKLKLNQLKGMQLVGQKMLENYDAIAKFDNVQGISVSDLKLLAFQDNNPYLISAREFNYLASSNLV